MTDLNTLIGYLTKKGSDFTEARKEIRTGNSFVTKNGVLQLSGSDYVRGVSLRTYKNNNFGFISTNNMEKENIKKLIEPTIKMLNRSKSDIKMAEGEVNKKTYEVKQKRKIENVDDKEKIEVLFDITKRLKEIENKKKVNMQSYLSLSTWTTEREYINSDGSIIKSKMPYVSFFYYITLIKGSKMRQRYWEYGATSGWESVDKWDIINLIPNEVNKMLENIEKGKKMKKKKMDVVVAPEVVGIMTHESVGHPYEADRIFGREAAQAGESFITTDMIGTKIGSNILTVVDDPTVKNSFGFYLYDDEGIRAREKVLIKNGFINELLHNRETAARLNIKSNAGARASSYDREPIVRMSNTFVKPGTMTEQELIEDIKDGVYIKNFTEWNIDDKRWNQKYVGCEAYKIKNGRIIHPVIAPVIEINTKKLWSSVDGIADNLELHAGSCGKGEPMQAIPVFFGGPSIRLRSIIIS